jgi:hypothetical protein
MHNLEEARNQNDILFHIENLEKDLTRSQYHANRNRSIYLAYESHLKSLKLIKELICKKTRFPWMELQNEMDLLYKTDKSITGYNLLFDFKKPLIPNRAFIKYNHFNNPINI